MSAPTTDYLIGCDLGRESDPAAVAVLSRTPRGNDPESPYYFEVRHVEEIPLRTPYPVLARYLARLASAPALLGRCNLAVDHTGPGVVMLDDLRELPELVEITWGVCYTSGTEDRQKLMNFKVPKRTLVSNLLVLMQKGLIGVSPGCRQEIDLKTQLLRFAIKRTARANDRFEAEGSGHDDLVNAVMVAAWLGGQVEQKDGTTGAAGGFLPYQVMSGNEVKGIHAGGGRIAGWRDAEPDPNRPKARGR